MDPLNHAQNSFNTNTLRGALKTVSMLPTPRGRPATIALVPSDSKPDFSDNRATLAPEHCVILASKTTKNKC